MTTDPDARLQKLIRRLKSADELKRIHAGLLLGGDGSGGGKGGTYLARTAAR